MKSNIKTNHYSLLDIEMNGEPKARAYMREWKRKDYAENGEKVRAKNKAYYYKYKYGLTGEDMRAYDIYLPVVAKIIDNLNKLKELKPDLIHQILQRYG